MTNPKITTFLMCPAANGDALGGTPAASAASGGHIKKSAWVHVFDAASVALFDLIVRAHERGAASHVARQQDDHDVGGEEGPEHGDSLEANAELAQRLADDEKRNRPVPAGSNADDEAQDRDENSQIAHGSLLLVVGAVSTRLLDQQIDAVAEQAATNGAENEDEEGHGSGLGARSASLDKRFERHLAFGEVAHGEHEFRRNAVISHLGDTTRRDAESISERFGSAALRFKPSFEIHGASLEQPKRLSQGFSKPRMFKLG